MKKVLLIGFLLILSNCFFSQNYTGANQELFFGRQSSAKIEAMGQAATAITSDLSSVYFNPAGISDLKGVQVYNNISRGYHTLDSSIFNFFGIGSKLGDKWVFAYTLQSFRRNITIPNGTFTKLDVKPDFVHKVACSYKPFKTFAIGISANLIDPVKFSLGNRKYYKSFYIDLGVIKEFKLFKNDIQQHSFNIGASISNFTNSKVKFFEYDSSSYYHLPIINRYGINYDFVLSKNWLIDSLNTFKISVVADYSFLYNSKFYTGINFGAQLEIFEFLSARIGYTNRSVDMMQWVVYFKENKFTYGFGINLPIYKLTKIPLQVNFDYCRLPIERTQTGIGIMTSLRNSNCFTGSIRWFFK